MFWYCVYVSLISENVNEQQNKKQNEIFGNWLYIFCTITQITKPRQWDTVNWTEGTVFFLQFPVFCIEGIFTLL